MKKSLIAFAVLAVASVGTFAHDQSLSNYANSGVSGNNTNYATSGVTGNGLSISTAGQTTSATAAAASTVYKVPGFNSSKGYGTTGGTLAGSTSTDTAGFAANVSIGAGATGGAGASGNADAYSEAGYNSKNNYVPLAVRQEGSSYSGAGQLSEVGKNGAAASAAGSEGSYAGAGFATRLPGYNAGNVSDLKATTSYGAQGGLGNVVGLGNSAGSNVGVSGCFKAASSGTTGSCSLSNANTQ